MLKKNGTNKFLAWRPKSYALWVIINLFAIALVAVIIGGLMYGWLDIWTHHGQHIEVPKVKGMSYYEAYDNLKKSGFAVEISDSIYDSKLPRGAVIEQNPKQGTIVKKGRTIFLTINAFSDKTVSIPPLGDISLRQAKSILEGLGIKNIIVKYVVSEYKDLVMGAKVNGKPIKPGQRVSINTTVTLEVGQGLPEEEDFFFWDDEPQDSDMELMDVEHEETDVQDAPDVVETPEENPEEFE